MCVFSLYYLCVYSPRITYVCIPPVLLVCVFSSVTCVVCIPIPVFSLSLVYMIMGISIYLSSLSSYVWSKCITTVSCIINIHLYTLGVYVLRCTNAFFRLVQPWVCEVYKVCILSSTFQPSLYRGL